MEFSLDVETHERWRQLGQVDVALPVHTVLQRLHR